jgi:hypothetical protein
MIILHMLLLIMLVNPRDEPIGISRRRVMNMAPYRWTGGAPSARRPASADPAEVVVTTGRLRLAGLGCQ